MEGLSRGVFDKAVKTHEGDKFTKGYRCWDQFNAMVYGQVSGSASLRELEAGFNAQVKHHYHLGTREVKRSTLSKANEKRSYEVYATIFQTLSSVLRGQRKKGLEEFLYLLDSTPLTLKGLGYDEWTRGNHNHRTQGLKVHVQLDAERDVPMHVSITPANVNDIDVGRCVEIERGAVYVFDKGYYDYNWWYSVHSQGAKFVTRFKRNARVQVLQSRAIAEHMEGTIVRDETVTFTHKSPGGARTNDYHGTPLRRVTVHRPDKSTDLVLVSNDFERSAQAIAQLYKRRWEIELFFKWLKQNLKIKRFYGRSENAVKVQIYIALITYLLVWLYRRRHGTGVSMHLCRVMLSTGLFQRPEVDDHVARRHRLHRQYLEHIQASLAFS